MNLHRLFKQVEKFTIDNSPAILTGMAAAGVVTTAILTARAGFRVGMDASTQWHESKGQTSLETRDIAKLYWKEYIPPAVSGVLTVVAVVGSNHISTRRAAAVATAYSISERAFSEYKEKVVEKLGEKRERAVRDEIAQDRVRDNPPNDNTVIITDGGEVLCYDHFSGRYFKSSMATLKKAENDINYQILHDGYASVSDFYDLIGLPVTSFSEEVGWNTDRKFEIVFSTVLSEDERPCISIDFDLSPNRKFSYYAGE